MKDNINKVLNKRPDYLKDDSISFKSKVFRLLGYTIIGTPKSYDLPNDFYDMPADRIMPNPKLFNQAVLEKNIKVNNIRRVVLARTGRYCAYLLTLVALVYFVVLFTGKGTNHLFRSNEAQQRNTPVMNNSSPSSYPRTNNGVKTCDDIINMYYSGQRRQISNSEMDKCGIAR